MKLPINIINRVFEYLADLNNSPKHLHFNENDESVSLKIHPQSSTYNFLHRINLFKYDYPPFQHTIAFQNDFRTQLFTTSLISAPPSPVSIYVMPDYNVWDEACTPVCIQFEMFTDTYAYMIYTRKQNPNWATGTLFSSGCILHQNEISIIPTISNPYFTYISGMHCKNNIASPHLIISLFSFYKPQNRELTTAIFKECGAWVFSNRLNTWVWINNDRLETEI